MNITIDKIQLRRGTAAAWTAANPILLDGEPGRETDTGKIKYGDGTTAWNSLTYFGAPSAWTVVASLPSGWSNVADAIGDDTIPRLATRTQPAVDSIEIRGHLAVTPTVAAGATAGIGRVTCAGVIPVGQRPAVLVTDVPAHFGIIPAFSPDLTLIDAQALAFVFPNGDLAFEIGTHFVDGTPFSTLFGTGGDWEHAALPDGITVLVVNGKYPLT